jgi:uncharacterized phosphosugar-binding protein
MTAAAELIADAVQGGRNLFAFGCNHAALVTLELFYRTGGLVLFNPIRGPGVTLDVSPVTLTSKMERLPGYGKVLLDESPVREGDVLLLHSVSGRNAVIIDMAIHASKIGVRTICLTNLTTTNAFPSRHESGLNLSQVCPIVIDSCGDLGDSSMELEGVRGRVAPTSTSIGTAIVNALVLEVCARLVERGVEPQVFMGSNVPGGDGFNAELLERNKLRIFYM